MSIATAPPISQFDERVSPYLNNPFLLFHSDPLKLIEFVWPMYSLYDRQVEIIESVRDNDETIVPAGNDLGKDFIAALTGLWFFLSRTPARVVTTSVDGSQLEGVLWGEIRRFLQTAEVPLPIQANHMQLRQVIDGALDGLSEMIGRVAKQGEGFLGRHIARVPPLWLPMCLGIYDEASALENLCYETSDTWTHRKLIIGNPYPCDAFFEKFSEAGDVPRKSGRGFKRKVIRIRGEDSPNVRLAQQEIAQGKLPSNTILIPGVLDWDLYCDRREHWDPIRQCVGLDAQFYKGKEVMLIPAEWIALSNRVARALKLLSPRRKALTLGVDSAEGNDSTVWTVIDRLGMLEWLSIKTADTSDIPGVTLAFTQRYRIAAENVLFDRGGGGKQHADRLRSQGHEVRTVAFGEVASDPHPIEDKSNISNKKEDVETRYIYKNRRAEMYGLLRLALEPSLECGLLETSEGEFIKRVDYCVKHEIQMPFAIPEQATDLIVQLKPLPLKYDGEGRLYLPSKNKKSAGSNEKTLREILGRSPDEADSLVLAVFGILDLPHRPEGGAITL